MSKPSKPLYERFVEKYVPEPMSGCWLWLDRLYGAGYGRMSIPDGTDKGLTEYAHRLSWILHKGPIPEGYYVLHQCDTACCVNPDHLHVGTAADNMREVSERLYTRVRYHAKLTRDDVVAILTSPENGKVIAKKYSVSPSLISMIRLRKIWNHPDLHLPLYRQRIPGQKSLPMEDQYDNRR